MDKKLKDSLSKIKLLICDIDGVLTDGSFIKSTSGEELRSFNALDGVGFVVKSESNEYLKELTENVRARGTVYRDPTGGFR